VRYLENGKLVPSRWSANTSDKETAEQFAKDNRKTLLAKYRHRKDESIYSILKRFYGKDSKYLEIEKNRGRTLAPRSRAIYHNFIMKVFIPFLRKQRIRWFEEITPPIINGLQNSLLEKGNKPQTINRYMGYIKSIFNHLVMHGKLAENVFAKTTMLRENKKDCRVRGCYEIEALRGVFGNPWEDRLSYTLCLLIYTTGLRNSEIERIRGQDFVDLEGVKFISVSKSKTENGIRLVPLHDFVYKQMAVFMKERGKRETTDGCLFLNRGRHVQSSIYRKANEDMMGILKLSVEETKNISFYSGRHFWKTLMSSEDLGDIEEYFMGHKVSRDVKKLYNHLDKRGQQKLVQKAKEVFRILDQYLF
jgi:integrase